MLFSSSFVDPKIVGCVSDKEELGLTSPWSSLRDTRLNIFIYSIANFGQPFGNRNWIAQLIPNLHLKKYNIFRQSRSQRFQKSAGKGKFQLWQSIFVFCLGTIVRSSDKPCPAGLDSAHRKGLLSPLSRWAATYVRQSKYRIRGNTFRSIRFMPHSITKFGVNVFQKKSKFRGTERV